MIIVQWTEKKKKRSKGEISYNNYKSGIQKLEIDNTIKKLQKDWILNQQIINKLQYKKSSSSEDIDKEFSIEFIQEDQKPMEQEAKENKIRENKKTEWKESFEKARAWYIDWVREKERRRKCVQPQTRKRTTRIPQ
jgi:hypothetical protein